MHKYLEFKSQKILGPQIHKCHTCERFANLTNLVSPQIWRFVELICVPPPLQICHWWCWYQCKFATGVDDTGGKFPICVVVLVVYLDLRISPSRILKKFEMTLVLFSGAWKRRIHEKTWSKKSCDAVPLKQNISTHRNALKSFHKTL
jgi:hypothetical protein